MKKFCLPILMVTSFSVFSSGKNIEVKNVVAQQGEVNPVGSNVHYLNMSGSTKVASFVPGAIITRLPAAVPPDQNKWAKCTNCSSLFYNGYGNKGRCPASGGQGHVADGKEYVLTYNSPGPGQNNWRFCNKCKALFFDGYPNKGVCKGGGGHIAAGFNFTLRNDAKATGERNWRFCNKCESLFFDEKSNKGVCAAGGSHVATGYNFVIDSPHFIY